MFLNIITLLQFLQNNRQVHSIIIPKLLFELNIYIHNILNTYYVDMMIIDIKIPEYSDKNSDLPNYLNFCIYSTSW